MKIQFVKCNDELESFDVKAMAETQDVSDLTTVSVSYIKAQSSKAYFVLLLSSILINEELSLFMNLTGD